jgi:ferrous-iron efflux pump FieF
MAKAKNVSEPRPLYDYFKAEFLYGFYSKSLTGCFVCPKPMRLWNFYMKKKQPYSEKSLIVETKADFSDLKESTVANQNKTLVTTATYAAVAVASILICAKFIAWVRTDSLSLKASLIDSLLDMAASVINLLVVRQALKPADAEHRFGHGKAEALSAIAQSAFIAGSALWLMIDAIHRLFTPVPLQSNGIGSLVMIASSILAFCLVIYQRYVIKRTRSLAISADSVHYLSDLYTNLGVLFSLNVSVWLGWVRLDAIIGAIIGAFIMRTSWVMGRTALDVLMDRELSDNARKRIIEIALANDRVWGVHDLRTRSAGQQDFIQMHLDMDEKLLLSEAHDVANAVELKVQEAFPQAEIIIHQDPLPYPGATQV